MSPRLACGLALLLGAAACSSRPLPELDGDGKLVLELGSGHKSLAASLRGLGVTLQPPRSLDEFDAPQTALSAGPRDAEPPAPAAPPARSSEPSSEPASEPSSEPSSGQPPPEPTSAQFLEVALQPRQTLMDLARQHLGSSAKFGEILQCNGWTEADARRLRIGQKVKIPLVRNPAPRRN